ncbi:glycoside hydrolase family 32 protein [Selenomonas ruminantium]|uniref:Sucrose-6-phosphate hydrolase n=1 Tax=Selenomonas ruminantium TaxID=971 RepID=A0A1I0Y0N2_SELRU|nr:glycoside hydrolase family 32 protein [Selenomonas ruminantium]SFB06825.1 beta-fructofuranosidase [Selenomonas ruminantium]
MQEAMKVTDQRFRLGYHLMTKGGWMNDPNGFSWFKGYYHMFYQYYPYAAEWGPMHWGHARSKDLVHWETLPVALAPDEHEDGCFSGSAVVYDDKLWLIYTGHHLTNPDDSEEFYQDQNIAWSEDGIHFNKYEGNPVLRAPADNTKHFRDPKVWQEGDTFYMVLGSQGSDELGRALLYESSDLKHWQPVSVLDKALNLKTEGYMWECPDFFHLDGQDVLLMSPQGLEPQGDCFRNLNQTGYLLGRQDEENHLVREEFTEIDRGHDFYATQTMLSPDGRRIMTAWMNAWDSPMYEKEDGWAGALTIPRELRVEKGRLYQQPVAELASMRVRRMLEGGLVPGSRISLPAASEVELSFKNCGDFSGRLLKLGDGEQELSISLDAKGSRIILERTTEDGQRAAQILPFKDLDLQIFVDRSSAEIFVNRGEITFTERMYWQGKLELALGEKAAREACVYALEKETNQY